MVAHSPFHPNPNPSTSQILLPHPKKSLTKKINNLSTNKCSFPKTNIEEKKTAKLYRACDGGGDEGVGRAC